MLNRGRHQLGAALLGLSTLLSLVALTSCQEEAPPAEPGQVNFARLELTEEQSLDLEPLSLAASWKVTEELEGVTITPPDFRARKRIVGGEVLPGLLLQSSEKLTVSIKGNYDPSTFNQVVLHHAASARQTIQVCFFSKGKLALIGAMQSPQLTQAPSPVALDFPRTREFVEPFDEVRITFRGKRISCMLFGMDLVERPWRSWLPPLSEPAPVEINLESRLAVGLSNHSAIEAETLLPPNPHLVFSFGQPRDLKGHGRSRVKLLVTVTQGQLKLSEQYLPGTNEKGLPAWRQVVLPLTGFKDRRAKIRFELLIPGEVEELVALGSPLVYTPMEAPPTVLLITSDTHRGDHLGVASHSPGVQTPFLDELAARGVHFQQAYSSTNVTIPSHVALMTATHPRDTKIITNRQQVSEAAVTLSERFREAGFATYCSVSAKLLAHDKSGLGQGFERAFRPNRTFLDAEETIDVLEGWLPEAEGRPLFMWLHLFDAHLPYEPPVGYDRMYWDEGKDPFDSKLPAVVLQNGATPQGVFPESLWELRELEYPHSQYMAEITYLDTQLGRMFAWPRVAQGVIAMTADHGESFGEHGIWFDHGGSYPQTVHVPLILAGPSVPVGEKTSLPVRQIDLGRTLLDLQGLTQVDFPGKNLLTAVVRPEAYAAPVFTLSAHGLEASITDHGHHLVLSLKDVANQGGTHTSKRCDAELYDLEKDPGCELNLWADPDHAELGQRMRAQLVQWLDSARPTGWARRTGSLSAEDEAELAKLGYAAGEEVDQQSAWFEDCDD